MPIPTAAKDSKDAITIYVVSHTRELTRQSAELRSDESQQRRVAGDRFYKDVDVIFKRMLFWGQESAQPAGQGSGGSAAASTGMPGIRYK